MFKKDHASRRKVLKATPTAGALVGLAGAGNVVSAKETVKIVTHRRGNKPVKTKQVPEQWLSHLNTARQVKEHLANRYGHRRDVKVFALTSDEQTYGNKRGFAVSVEVMSEEAKSDLPKKINDIPIKFENYEVRKYMSCYNTGDFDNVPGGVIFGGGGTSGSQYYIDTDGDGTYEEHHITAAHVIGDPCFDQTGTTVTQDGDDWGEAVLQSGSLDTIACEPYSGFDVDNEIKEESDSVVVAGYVTKNGLADMDTYNEKVYKTGRETGTVDGYIENLEESSGAFDCTDYRGEGVEVDIDVSAGDSGGPMYDKDNGDAYMVGLVSAGHGNTDRTDCEGDEILRYTEGPSAYEITNALRGQFTQPI